MNKIFLFFRTKGQTLKSKNSGSVLLVVIILVTLILTVGLGVAKIMTREIRFSADLLFAEKAYFGAESGIEIALLELKKEPVQAIDEEFYLSSVVLNEAAGVIVNDKSVQTDLKVRNLLERVEFRVAPKKTTKFLLRRDIVSTGGPDGFTTELEPVENFSFRITVANPYLPNRTQWKVLCQKDSGGTVSIQGIIHQGLYALRDLVGTYDDEDGNSFGGRFVSAFFQDPGLQTKSCFFSVQNLNQDEEGDLQFSFTAPEFMSPPVASVHSTGTSGNRSKKTVFDYDQKGLGSFFDFGFFHTERGLE